MILPDVNSFIIDKLREFSIGSSIYGNRGSVNCISARVFDHELNRFVAQSFTERQGKMTTNCQSVVPMIHRVRLDRSRFLPSRTRMINSEVKNPDAKKDIKVLIESSRKKLIRWLLRPCLKRTLVTELWCYVPGCISRWVIRYHKDSCKMRFLA